MTTLPLRELLRHPTTVKRLTAAGQSVQVTDNGKPLWVLRSATAPSLADADRQLVDDELDAMLAERRSPVSAAQLHASATRNQIPVPAARVRLQRCPNCRCSACWSRCGYSSCHRDCSNA